MQMNRHKDELAATYRQYISCLNDRTFASLGRFVHPAVVHNGRPLGLDGYRQMLESNVRAIPDLQFDIQLLTVDPPYVGSRLGFNCTPTGELFGFPVNGRRIQFTENVFYEFLDSRIKTVWSVIDEAAIRRQIGE
ncbi:ester cyclase [Salinisphaera hydrothermalis]|uniref:ester cyclase n=1 Tax=Salinisphaera hydrothermalis TaxID=563188 RepID=UPI00333F11AC